MKRYLPLNRQNKFIHMMMQFIDKYNYDGIEIDWEKQLQLPLHRRFPVQYKTQAGQPGEETQ